MDHELAQRASAGDPRSLRELLERLRCVPRVLAVLNARRGSPLNEHDLADLAQDTIVLVWKKLGSFRESATLESWAYGIARFEFQNLARRRGRILRQQVEIVLEDQPGAGGDPYEEVDLEGWLGRIAPDQARIVRLKHVEGLTFGEIADREAIHASTAKTRYYRALKQIEGHLDSTRADECAGDERGGDRE
jgi:RNA polymerase sigma-70 factor, ECF subfamily